VLASVKKEWVQLARLFAKCAPLGLGVLLIHAETQCALSVLRLAIKGGVGERKRIPERDAVGLQNMLASNS
jgi:hypothetical protein